MQNVWPPHFCSVLSGLEPSASSADRTLKGLRSSAATMISYLRATGAATQRAEHAVRHGVWRAGTSTPSSEVGAHRHQSRFIRPGSCSEGVAHSSTSAQSATTSARRRRQGGQCTPSGAAAEQGGLRQPHLKRGQTCRWGQTAHPARPLPRAPPRACCRPLAARPGRPRSSKPAPAQEAPHTRRNASHTRIITPHHLPARDGYTRRKAQHTRARASQTAVARGRPGDAVPVQAGRPAARAHLVAAPPLLSLVLHVEAVGLEPGQALGAHVRPHLRS